MKLKTKQLLTTKFITIKKALKIISKTGKKCLVIIHNNKLVGTLSDGDIRSALLKSFKLQDNIDKIYNKNPFFIKKTKYNLNDIKKIFIKKKYDLIPVINSLSKVIDVICWEDLFSNNIKFINKKNFSVVIMAGGLGTRLHPFTKVLPKPLIPINGKPIIQNNIDKLNILGIKKIYITINYKANVIKAFFKDLKPKYKVSFIEEKKPLGTVGSLNLIKFKKHEIILLTNCDIIFDFSLDDFLSFHKKSNNDLTIAASTKEFVIPYGNCIIDENGKLKELEEKPTYTKLINIGVYFLSSSIIKFIPKNQKFDMNQLIKKLKTNKKNVGIFPVSNDTWSDIGQLQEYKETINKF